MVLSQPSIRGAVRRGAGALLLSIALTAGLTGLYVPEAQAATTSWGQWHPGTLSAAKPKATYTFVASAKTTARFVLGDLGANYKLTLLSRSFQTLATSDRPGVQSEEIIRSLDKGTYYVVATSPAKQYTTAAFALRGHAISGVAVLSTKARVMPDGMFQLAVDLYNTTSVPQDWRATLKFYDAQGGFLRSESLGVWVAAVLPRSHGLAGEGLSSSYANAAPPKGWASYKITEIRTEPQRCITNVVMPVTNFSAVADPADPSRWRWSGLVRNKNTTREKPQMAIATFDSRGNIVSGHGFYSGYVAAGEAQSWSATGSRYSGVNRTSITSLQYGFACEDA